MKKFLFIAEKPSSMREFQSVYKKHKYEVDNIVGGSIDFIALRGHVFRNLEPKEYDAWDKKWVQLYESDLPMIPKTWKVTAISGRRRLWYLLHGLSGHESKELQDSSFLRNRLD